MALTKIQTAGITDDAIDSDHYVDASIDNAHLADDAIDADKLASNSVVSASIVDGAIVNADINASAAIAASKIAGIPVANRNVMINGQFDVWQRGTSFVYGPSMTAHNYYMDRFRHEGAAWTGSVTQQTFTNGQTDVPGNPTYYARWIVSTVNAGGVSFIQRLENYPLNRHSGKTYTVSVWLKSVSGTIADGDVTIYGGAGTLGAITTTWQKFTKTTTVGTQGSAYGPNWGLTVPTTVLLTSGIDIANFQVEEGSVATDFEQKSFSETLAECQRYYQKSYNTTVNPGTASAVGASSGSAIYSSGSQGLGARWITTMRAAPTVTLYTPGGTSGNVNNTANNADISATAGDIGENGFQYVSGSLPNSAASGYRFHWTAEAEL